MKMMLFDTTTDSMLKLSSDSKGYDVKNLDLVCLTLTIGDKLPTLKYCIFAFYFIRLDTQL